MADAQKTAMRARLAQAATDVFGAQGYHAARVSDIVRRAGVAQGTFYLYFDSKEAIFLHLIDDFFARLLNETLHRYPAQGLNTADDLSRQLRQMWRTLLARCRQEPVLTALVLRESAALGPATRAQVAQRFAGVVAAIAGYLDAVAAQGWVRPDIADPTAWALLGLIERAIHYAVVVAPMADVDALADEFLKLELCGLRRNA